MIKSLRVLLWNEEIGRLAWDEHRKLSYFTYNPEFVKKGLNISPLLAPLNGVRALTPIWGEEGIPLLQRLNQLANGRIKIMAGCGVNEKNIARIRQETSVPAFHFSAREPQASRMTYSNPSVYMGAEGADEDTIMLTTERRVRNTIDALMGKMA